MIVWTVRVLLRFRKEAVSCDGEGKAAAAPLAGVTATGTVTMTATAAVVQLAYASDL